MQLVSDLSGKLASGGQDQCLYLVTLPVNAVNYRDSERRGLARPCLCLPDDVFSLEQQWYRQLLNWSRRFELHVIERIKYVITDVEVLEIDLLFVFDCYVSLLWAVGAFSGTPLLERIYQAAALWFARSCAYSAATSMDASMAVALAMPFPAISNAVP